MTKNINASMNPFFSESHLNCELCGSNIRGEPQVVNLDGGVFRVCNNCSRLGTPARVPKPAKAVSTFSAGTQFAPKSTISKPRTAPPPSPGFQSAEEDMMLRDDYSRVIKNARELLGITQEELGRKINEKPSVISHLEVGSMKPDDILAGKLEHFLKIQLFIPVEEEESEGAS